MSDCKHYGYIYLTTNLTTGEKYIGQHKSSVFQPSKYMGSGVDFKKAVKKYGKENFHCELIEWCDSYEHLNARELYWIWFYHAVDDDSYYNKARGGTFPIGNLRPVICIETQQVFDSVSEAINFCKGDVTAALAGKTQTTAGGYHWAYVQDTESQKRLNSFIGCTPSGNYGQVAKRDISVICIETQEIFKITGKMVNGIPYRQIRLCCLGKSNTAGGYHWAFAEDSDRISRLLNFKGRPQGYHRTGKQNLKNYKPIRCIETEEIFSSINAAQSWLNSRGRGWIPGVLRGTQQTAGGYHWEYV